MDLLQNKGESVGSAHFLDTNKIPTTPLITRVVYTPPKSNLLIQFWSASTPPLIGEKIEKILLPQNPGENKLHSHQKSIYTTPKFD